MKNLSKTTAALLATIIAMSALSGCGNTKPKKDDEQVYNFSSASAVIGLNPILNTTGPDNAAADFFLETLVSDVADKNSISIIKPAVASSWDISEDGTVYTFHIRPEAKWSDGVDLTANDFLYTYRMMATPEIASTNGWLFDGIIKDYGESLFAKEGKKPEDIGVKVIDDKTLEITLVKATPYFLELLSGAKPIRQDKYEEFGTEYGSTFTKVAMNGPYTIESWDQNVQMTFVKNPNYWDAANVKLEKINRKVIQETATNAQALLSGDIDILTIKEPEWVKMIEDDGRFEKIEGVGNSPEFFTFNCGNKYFKNPKIRIAFSLAIDRERFVSELLDGAAEPLYTLMPSVSGVAGVDGKLYSEIVNNKNMIIKDMMAKYPDPKALLIEGLKEEGLDPDPAKMNVTLISRGTSAFSKKMAEWMLQEYREKLGVEIKIDVIEWNIMWDRVKAGDYEIATAGWGPYYNDPYDLLSLYDPVDGYFDTKKTGWTGPDSDKYHELLVKSEVTIDPIERAQILLEAETILVGTGVIAPTYVGKSNTYLNKYVKGYYENPHSATDYSLMYIQGK
ncbi:MAG: peptide ABC transporter substrate-binding protein [Oscillospiraceae bacterium]